MGNGVLRETLRCLAIGDVENHTALHCHAGRTQPSAKGEGRQGPLEFYTNFILERAKGLLEISKILCTDAYFAKATFIGPMKKAGFTLVGRLQHNIFLRYRYLGAQKGKGRRKIFVGVKRREKWTFTTLTDSIFRWQNKIGAKPYMKGLSMYAA